MSVHQLKDGRWIVKIPDPDKRSGSRREYFGRGAGAEAGAKARDQSLNLMRTRPRTGDTGPTFHELAMAYLEHKSFVKHSFAMINSELKSAILPAIANIPAINLTHNDLDRFIQKRRQSVKSNTIRREVGIIQAIMNWSVNRRPQMIPMNPLKGFSPPKRDDAVIYPPTLSEIKAILQHANERLRRFIWICWFTGARPGRVETVGIRWDAVSWETGTIRVTSAKKGGVRLRDVPLHPDFMAELKRWKAADAARGIDGPIIHLGKKGRAVVRVDWSWDQAKKKAGVTRRLPLYSLRHWFVTAAIESGADYKTLSDVVGSDPETLRRHYQHVSNAARISMIERMPTLNSTSDNAGNF